AFDTAPGLPLRDIELNYRLFVPLGSSSANDVRVNFDGVLKTSNANPEATQHRAYVQLRRNGIIESATSSLIPPDRNTIPALDDVLIQHIMRCLNDLVGVGIEPPYALLISLAGVSGARFRFARDPWGDDIGRPLDRDQYHFDEVIFETIPQS